MGIFSKQIEFLRKTKDELLFSSLQEVFGQFDFVVKDFIVNKQLFREGIDGKGTKLEAYKRSTIRIKLTKQQPVNRTTLHDSERFVDSIVIDSFTDRFEVKSDVIYDKYIIEKYGIDVLRPTSENLEEFLINFYLPAIKEKIQQELKN